MFRCQVAHPQQIKNPIVTQSAGRDLRFAPTGIMSFFFFFAGGKFSHNPLPFGMANGTPTYDLGETTKAAFAVTLGVQRAVLCAGGYHRIFLIVFIHGFFSLLNAH
jgi:hypothetical protein